MSKTFDPHYKELPVFAKVGQKIVIFNSEGQVLFLRRSQKSTRAGGWDFPGGGLNKGEDPLTGIKRELNEETKLSAKDISPIHIESKIDDKNEFLVMIGYKGKTDQTQPTLSWEHDHYEWFSIQEAIHKELPPIHKAFLEKAIENNEFNQP